MLKRKKQHKDSETHKYYNKTLYCKYIHKYNRIHTHKLRFMLIYSYKDKFVKSTNETNSFIDSDLSGVYGRRQKNSSSSIAIGF